jgi:hypothetical protein
MKAIPYLKIFLLLAAIYSLQGCYEATGRRDTMPLQYVSNVDLTESRPDLIQSRLDSLLAFMIRNEIVEIQLIKNNLRFEVVMRKMKDEHEINNYIFDKMLKDIELRNSTHYTGFQDYTPESDAVLNDYEKGLTNFQDDLILSIRVSKNLD